MLFFFSKMKQGLLPSLEDLLFYTIAEGQEKIPVHKFITVSLLFQSAVWKQTTASFVNILNARIQSKEFLLYMVSCSKECNFFYFSASSSPQLCN